MSMTALKQICISLRLPDESCSPFPPPPRVPLLGLCQHISSSVAGPGSLLLIHYKGPLSLVLQFTGKAGSKSQAGLKSHFTGFITCNDSRRGRKQGEGLVWMTLININNLDFIGVTTSLHVVGCNVI